jgi:hypothetical protein
MKKLSAFLVAGVLAMAGVVTGCGGGGEAVVTTVPDRSGSVTFRWSVDGSFDPRACDAFFVDSARIDLYDANGAPINTTFVDCRAFTATINLAPGRYSARIEMVDVNNEPRSTSLPIQPFTIVSDTNLNIDSDFPRDSFF